MNSLAAPAATPGFPRYFKIFGHWVNSYKVMLCVGIYAGTLTSAWLAERSGFSPLRMGLGALACAISGLFGARIYHMIVFAAHYAGKRSFKALWDTRSGGWSVFGALLTLVPLSFVMACALRIPFAHFWDYMSAGILVGGFWVRLGCVFNGCCCGRETKGWYGVCLHDTCGVTKSRIPVQFLEMAWWLSGAVIFFSLWSRSFPSGAYGLGVLCWYGFGRFWLEPLREAPDRVAGRIRINQVVAGALALLAGSALLIRILL